MKNSLDTTQERVFVETADATHDAFREQCFTVDVNQDTVPMLETVTLDEGQSRLAPSEVTMAEAVEHFDRTGAYLRSDTATLPPIFPDLSQESGDGEAIDIVPMATRRDDRFRFGLSEDGSTEGSRPVIGSRTSLREWVTRLLNTI